MPDLVLILKNIDLEKIRLGLDS